MDATLRYQSLKLAAIEAIAAGRLVDAAAALEQLVAQKPIANGVCRYCGCSDLRPCGVAIVIPGVGSEVASCAWVDELQTVCSSTRCMDAWTRDVSYPPPASVGESRLVRP